MLLNLKGKAMNRIKKYFQKDKSYRMEYFINGGWISSLLVDKNTTVDEVFEALTFDGEAVKLDEVKLVLNAE